MDLQTLQNHRVEILDHASRYGANNVRVFGSVARGDSTADSDVDLLVDVERGRSLLDLIGLNQDLERLLRCSIDVLTEAELSPYFRDQVLDEAVVL